MPNKYFRYRKGDGNEGNFVQSAVILGEHDCPYAALNALVVNDYIAGRSRRRWIAKNLEIDGEPENPQAMICYGPRGEQAFGAAWLTAELEPIDSDDVDDSDCKHGLYRSYGDCWLSPVHIRQALDKGARAILDAATPSPGTPAAIRRAAEQALHWLEAEIERRGETTPDEIVRTLRAALGE